jgi:hypothetical protein
MSILSLIRRHSSKFTPSDLFVQVDRLVALSQNRKGTEEEKVKWILRNLARWLDKQIEPPNPFAEALSDVAINMGVAALELLILAKMEEYNGLTPERKAKLAARQDAIAAAADLPSEERTAPEAPTKARPPYLAPAEGVTVVVSPPAFVRSTPDIEPDPTDPTKPDPTEPDPKPKPDPTEPDAPAGGSAGDGGGGR